MSPSRIHMTVFLIGWFFSLSNNKVKSVRHPFKRLNILFKVTDGIGKVNTVTPGALLSVPQSFAVFLSRPSCS